MRTSLLHLVLYRPLCTGFCHRGSCSRSDTRSKWWKRWVFLRVWNPTLSALVSRSVFYRSLSTNYFLPFLLFIFPAISFLKSVGILDFSPKPLPLLPTFHPSSTQRFWYSPLGYGSRVQQLRIWVKDLRPGAWWHDFKSFTLPLTSYVTLGKLALLSLLWAPVKWDSSINTWQVSYGD